MRRFKFLFFRFQGGNGFGKVPVFLVQVLDAFLALLDIGLEVFFLAPVGRTFPDNGVPSFGPHMVPYVSSDQRPRPGN